MSRIPKMAAILIATRCAHSPPRRWRVWGGGESPGVSTCQTIGFGSVAMDSANSVGHGYIAQVMLFLVGRRQRVELAQAPAACWQLPQYGFLLASLLVGLAFASLMQGMKISDSESEHFDMAILRWSKMPARGLFPDI